MRITAIVGNFSKKLFNGHVFFGAKVAINFVLHQNIVCWFF